MALVIGFDASFGGIGWCIGTERGPYEAGFYRPSSTHRMPGVMAFLEALELKVIEYELERRPSDPKPRVVIERVPWSYSRRGSQARVVWSIGGVAHMIGAWGTRRHWGTPWFIPPKDDRKWVRNRKTPREKQPGWRQWWGISGKGRYMKKRDAIRKVYSNGWGHLICNLRPLDDEGNGEQGDVAEGILIAVGGARNLSQAPKCPVKWPKVVL